MSHAHQSTKQSLDSIMDLLRTKAQADSHELAENRHNAYIAAQAERDRLSEQRHVSYLTHQRTTNKRLARLEEQLQHRDRIIGIQKNTISELRAHICMMKGASTTSEFDTMTERAVEYEQWMVDGVFDKNVLHRSYHRVPPSIIIPTSSAMVTDSYSPPPGHVFSLPSTPVGTPTTGSPYSPSNPSYFHSEE